LAAGVRDNLVDLVAARLIERGDIKVDAAREVLAEIESGEGS
jgi:hypothetical protein